MADKWSEIVLSRLKIFFSRTKLPIIFNLHHQLFIILVYGTFKFVQIMILRGQEGTLKECSKFTIKKLKIEQRLNNSSDAVKGNYKVKKIKDSNYTTFCE